MEAAGISGTRWPQTEPFGGARRRGEAPAHRPAEACPASAGAGLAGRSAAPSGKPTNVSCTAMLTTSASSGHAPTLPSQHTPPRFAAAINRPMSSWRCRPLPINRPTKRLTWESRQAPRSRRAPPRGKRRGRRQSPRLRRFCPRASRPPGAMPDAGPSHAPPGPGWLVPRRGPPARRCHRRGRRPFGQAPATGRSAGGSERSCRSRRAAAVSARG